MVDLKQSVRVLGGRLCVVLLYCIVVGVFGSRRVLSWLTAQFWENSFYRIVSRGLKVD